VLLSFRAARGGPLTAIASVVHEVYSNRELVRRCIAEVVPFRDTTGREDWVQLTIKAASDTEIAVA
jgi:hypothetical protein